MFHDDHPLMMLTKLNFPGLVPFVDCQFCRWSALRRSYSGSLGGPVATSRLASAILRARPSRRTSRSTARSAARQAPRDQPSMPRTHWRSVRPDQDAGGSEQVNTSRAAATRREESIIQPTARRMGGFFQQPAKLLGKIASRSRLLRIATNDRCIVWPPA